MGASGAGERSAEGCGTDEDCASDTDRCTYSLCDHGTCVQSWMVDCDDGDVCTIDECVPSTGVCKHEPATPDLDGDGHRAPRPGKTAGAPDACGDDCNDADAIAHPGGREACDGVDNDCNGIVDDGTTLAPAGRETRISDMADSASPESIGFSSQLGTYLVSYSATPQGTQLDAYYVVSLDRSGDRVSSPKQFTQIAASAYAGPLAWTGDRFGTLWADRRNARGRDNNYEIYFNEMAPDGTKLGADVRITQSVGFSVNPSLVWSGNGFIAAWQDSGPSDNQVNEIFAQRIGLDGQPIGTATHLASEEQDGQEAPVVANGAHTIGVAWMHGSPGDQRVEFATFSPSFELVGGPIELSDGAHPAVSPTVVYGMLGYAIAWYDPNVVDPTPIRGAVVDEQAHYVVEPKPLTETPRHSRHPFVLGYGDRVLLLWSDNKDENLGYEVYAKVLDLGLDALTEEMRVTKGTRDSIGPVAAFGPAGDVGIVFRDEREGSAQAYFARLACASTHR